MFPSPTNSVPGPVIEVNNVPVLLPAAGAWVTVQSLVPEPPGVLLLLSWRVYHAGRTSDHTVRGVFLPVTEGGGPWPYRVHLPYGTVPAGQGLRVGEVGPPPPPPPGGPRPRPVGFQPPPEEVDRTASRGVVRVLVHHPRAAGPTPPA